MSIRYRLRYNGHSYAFDENPLDGVDVTKVQTIERETHREQKVTILVSPEIPMSVETYESSPSRARFL